MFLLSPPPRPGGWLFPKNGGDPIIRQSCKNTLMWLVEIVAEMKSQRDAKCRNAKRVAELDDLHRAGKSYQKIAKSSGLSRETVRRAIQRHRRAAIKAQSQQ